MPKAKSKLYKMDSGVSSKVQETPDAVMEIGAFDAKTHFSELLAKVSHGATFYITKHGKRIAEIKPAEKEKPKMRNLGDWKGRIWIADDFDAPLEDFKEYME